MMPQAVAQLEVLGMLNGMESVVDLSSSVVTLESLSEPGSLLARICDENVKAKRRRLGMMLRCRVFKVFSIERYLREHEQHLWIAALQCENWDLWQLVQRYVMPRTQTISSIESFKLPKQTQIQSPRGFFQPGILHRSFLETQEAVHSSQLVRTRSSREILKRHIVYPSSSADIEGMLITEKSVV